MDRQSSREGNPSSADPRESELTVGKKNGKLQG